MNSPSISYVIHIAATPEDLWGALTSPRSLELTWGKIRSAWTVGSEVTEVSKSGEVLWKGEVLRSDAPRLLSYTFDVTGSGEAASEVTFTMDAPASKVGPGAAVVRLTLTHSGFGDNSELFSGCARAWPEILSSLKSYVETGRPLPFVWNH
jgi:uncharacterized protein YndB with AHSA1/START domain